MADKNIVDGYVIQKGLVLKDDDINQTLLLKLKKLCNFSVKKKSMPGRPAYYQKVISIKKIEGGYIIPKFIKYPFNLINKLKIKTLTTTCSVKPIDNQKQVLEYLTKNIYNAENISNGIAGVSIKASTGIGKSFIAYMCINMLQMKTLIIVPNVEIAKQHYNLLQAHFTCEIGQYNCKVKKDGDIVVAVVDSLMLPNLTFKTKEGKTTVDTIKYLRKFSFVVYDEPQMYVSPKRRGIFNRATGICSLALSATYEDAGGMEKWIFQRAGPLYDISHIGETTQWNLTTKLVYYNGPTEHTEIKLNSQGINDYNETLKMLGGDPYRNKMGLDYARKYQDKGVYIITYHRDHVELLARLLNNVNIESDTPEVVNIIQLVNKYQKEIIEEIKKMKTKKDLYLEVFNTIHKTQSLDCIDEIYNKRIPYKNKSFFWKKIEGIAKQFNDTATTLYGKSDRHDAPSAFKTPILITTFSYGSVGISIKEKTVLILFMSEMAKQKQCVGRILRKGYDDEHERIVIDIVDNRCWIKKQLTFRKRIYKEHPNNTFEREDVNWEDVKLD